MSAGLPKLPALSSRAALLASPRLSFQRPQLLVRPAVSAPVRRPAAASSAEGGMQLPGSNLACQGSSERWQGREVGGGDADADAGCCDLDSEASSVEVRSVACLSLSTIASKLLCISTALFRSTSLLKCEAHVLPAQVLVPLEAIQLEAACSDLTAYEAQELEEALLLTQERSSNGRSSRQSQSQQQLLLLLQAAELVGAANAPGAVQLTATGSNSASGSLALQSGGDEVEGLGGVQPDGRGSGTAALLAALPVAGGSGSGGFTTSQRLTAWRRHSSSAHFSLLAARAAMSGVSSCHSNSSSSFWAAATSPGAFDNGTVAGSPPMPAGGAPLPAPQHWWATGTTCLGSPRPWDASFVSAVPSNLRGDSGGSSLSVARRAAIFCSASGAVPGSSAPSATQAALDSGFNMSFDSPAGMWPLLPSFVGAPAPPPLLRQAMSVRRVPSRRRWAMGSSSWDRSAGSGTDACGAMVPEQHAVTPDGPALRYVSGSQGGTSNAGGGEVVMTATGGPEDGGSGAKHVRVSSEWRSDTTGTCPTPILDPPATATGPLHPASSIERSPARGAPQPAFLASLVRPGLVGVRRAGGAGLPPRLPTLQSGSPSPTSTDEAGAGGATSLGGGWGGSPAASPATSRFHHQSAGQAGTHATTSNTTSAATTNPLHAPSWSRHHRVRSGGVDSVNGSEAPTAPGMQAATPTSTSHFLAPHRSLRRGVAALSSLQTGGSRPGTGMGAGTDNGEMAALADGSECSSKSVAGGWCKHVFARGGGGAGHFQDCLIAIWDCTTWLELLSYRMLQA